MKLRPIPSSEALPSYTSSCQVKREKLDNLHEQINTNKEKLKLMYVSAPPDTHQHPSTNKYYTQPKTCTYKLKKSYSNSQATLPCNHNITCSSRSSTFVLSITTMEWANPQATLHKKERTRIQTLM